MFLIFFSGYFSPFRTCKVDYNYFQGEKCDINPKVRLSSEYKQKFNLVTFPRHTLKPINQHDDQFYLLHLFNLILGAVFFSGISASMSAFFLAISSGLTIVQLINVGNRKPAVVKNSAIVLVTLLSALSSVAGFALFLIQGDDLQRGFQITWGPSFYAFVFSAVLSIVLFIITICDYMNIRKRDNSFGLTVRNTTNL